MSALGQTLAEPAAPPDVGCCCRLVCPILSVRFATASDKGLQRSQKNRVFRTLQTSAASAPRPGVDTSVAAEGCRLRRLAKREKFWIAIACAFALVPLGSTPTGDSLSPPAPLQQMFGYELDRDPGVADQHAKNHPQIDVFSRLSMA